MNNQETKIVNIKSKQPYDIYIGRANKTYGVTESKWHNPFVIGRDGNRVAVISKFQQYILYKPELLRDLHEIDGKILCCWCDYPNEDCHGRILLELRQNQIKDNLKHGRAIDA